MTFPSLINFPEPTSEEPKHPSSMNFLYSMEASRWLETSNDRLPSTLEKSNVIVLFSMWILYHHSSIKYTTESPGKWEPLVLCVI